MTNASERGTVDSDAFRTDPIGTLRAAREVGPVAVSDLGLPVVLNHGTVRTLLGDARLRADFAGVLALFGVTEGPFYEWMAVSPLNHDGEAHKRWRALFSRTFTPRSVEEVRPFLATAADELVGGFASAGHCELMADFADVLPALGLCEHIGVPAKDRERFRAWANVIGYGFRPGELLEHLDEVDAALVELIAYSRDLLEQRRADPRDDLVSRLAENIDGPEGYDIADLSAFVAGLVFAGNDTTRNQLGWSVAELSAQPALWDAIGSGEIAIADAVEELLRHRSAVAAIGRTVDEDIDVEGEPIPGGMPVLLSLWGANHDPAVFPAPDALDPSANAGCPHLSFGHGPHHCLGAALARAELQEGLRSLTAAITCPVVGPDAEWSEPLGINGPRRLPLTFTPRTNGRSAAVIR